MIPFNKIHLTGNEEKFISEVISSGKIAGNGIFTKKVHQFFKDKYGIKKSLLTSSCTDALEMASILLDIKSGDEIILPSYTFVSTANPFLLRGAKLVFADSKEENPNIDENKIEELITEKTKAIVVMHYAGIACEMDKIMQLASKYNLFVVEDAAHAIEAFYKNKPLGTIGHLGALSFHESKNITSGEGGILFVNDEKLITRAEIIWEKGTNRASFLRGDIDKYGWKDIGSSFYPNELTAAFLFAQLSELEIIQQKRVELWHIYYEKLLFLESEGCIILPKKNDFCTNNGHLFYFTCKSKEVRDDLISYLNSKNISTAFHFLSLHKSDFFIQKHDGRILENTENFSERLIRLPLYFDLSSKEISSVCYAIQSFFDKEI